MKERPILFSGPMVRAILEGRKTQTRRVVKWQGPKDFPHYFNRAFLDNPAGIKRLCVPFRHPEEFDAGDGNPAHRHYPPYGEPGDRLWVRETWGIMDTEGDTVMIARAERMPPGKTLADTDGGLELFQVESDTARWAEKRIDTERWRPSIFMPRWASRITLEITGVRVERLQEISDADAISEGVTVDPDANKWPICTPSKWYAYLWDSINFSRAPWASNPWVWVIEFRPTPAREG